MWRILSILFYIPKIIVLGIYKCLNYGNEEQLFYLTSSLTIFLLNIKCSKSIGVEDFMILVFFIYIMHYFTKLEKENLYLQRYGNLAKVIMSVLYRQNKANKKVDINTKDVEKVIKKLSGTKIEPKIIWIENPPTKPTPEPIAEIKEPIIELSDSEYETIECEYEKFGGYLK